MELLLLGGRRGNKGTEGRIKSHTPTQNSSSLSTWLVNDLCTFLDQYILYLALLLLTPYHSICSWWHRETALRLPKRRQFTSFGDIWCISQSSQQARPYQKKSKLPLKIQNCAVYATTTPGEQNNRFPVLFFRSFPNFQKTPRPLFRSFPNISRRSPIYLPLSQKCRLQTPAINQIFKTQSKTFLHLILLNVTKTNPSDDDIFYYLVLPQR